jgi:hypothetical protein
MAAIINDQQVPRSVHNLWHGAQISHCGIASPAEILGAIQTGGGEGKARHSLALGIQESTTWELIDLMVDKILDGQALHSLIKRLHNEGSIRRSDLVEWSEIFT